MTKEKVPKSGTTTNCLTSSFTMKIDNALKEVLTSKAKAGGLTLSNTIELYLKYGLKSAGKKSLPNINKELI